MRGKSGTADDGAPTIALVRRLAREFIRPHGGAIVFAFACMGVAAGSTALRAWLMQPMLDRIFVGREANLLLVIAGAALALAILKGFADYGEAVLMGRVGEAMIADIRNALY
ncbi:MAG TPA: hypothetical protein VM782_02130, partial [Stellaceae bacterium]|nr:hypothetical protein [Stellaceae bacterium]